MVADNLNEKQVEATEHEQGPLLIVAGAGSGKTRTLTTRIIRLLAKGALPEKILAITFTNKAANEMRKRVADKQNKLFIGTFHSFGAKILREEAQQLERNSNFTIFDDADSTTLLRKVVKNLDLPKEKIKLAAWSYKIGKIKSSLEEIGGQDDPLMELIFKEYEQALQKNNAFDFDDLIEKPVRIFNENKRILDKYQRRFEHILVDEFQDTNIAQYALVKLLAEKHGNLSVVGDDAQSIYGWRHADFRNFLYFDKDWPGAKVIKLEENYRSTANIIKAANQVIKNNKLQKEKALWTKNNEGGLIKIIETADEEEEADWVAENILERNPSLSRGMTGAPKTGEVAILYRTNAQSRAMEQALLYRQIPYQIFGGIKFYERKEIKDIIAGLRLAFNQNDEVGLERLKKNFSKTKSEFLTKELPRLAKKLTVAQLINFIINNTDYLTYLENNFKNSRERIENVQELIDYAGSQALLGEFLEKISLVQAQDENKAEGGIKLMTIHTAKGLEFDEVFLIGCAEGFLPHQKSYNTNEQLEEERRLMYVAMTRARKNLIITFSGIASRFLYEMPPELVEFQSVANKNKWDNNYLEDEEERWITYD